MSPEDKVAIRKEWEELQLRAANTASRDSAFDWVALSPTTNLEHRIIAMIIGGVVRVRRNSWLCEYTWLAGRELGDDKQLS